MKKLAFLVAALTMTMAISGCSDPDCTPEKAAKRQVQKATVGVGNRCTPQETAKDTAGLE